MNSTMTRTTRRIGVTAGALLVSALVQLPASARPDAGEAPKAASTAASESCALERLGRQLVRCDALTGAGVAAPLWVPEAGVDVAPASFGSTPSTGGAPQAPWSFAP